MGYTMAEKILAVHAGKERVEAGEIVEVTPDVLLANDVTAPPAIAEMKRMGAEIPFDPGRVVFVMDHFTPNRDTRTARACRTVRDWSTKTGIKRFYDGAYGIEHVVLPEDGIVAPGDLVIGADSHTTTYGAMGAFATGVGQTDLAAAMALGRIWLKVPETIKIEFDGGLPEWIGGKDLILLVLGDIGVDGALYCALEFGGEGVKQLEMDGRFTMCNMAIEAGAKAGLIEPDEETWRFVAATGNQRGVGYASDPDCQYREIKRYDISRLEPLVALPHLPSNVKPVSQVSGIEIDQVVIGSCTNGRLQDLRTAARVLRGRKVHRRVRTLVVPGSQKVFRQALKEGTISDLAEAGAAICMPTCGPCFGGHTGVLDEGERCVSTTNRNFIGRMGHEKSEVYLANPAVAAASAVAGRIAHPEEVVKR